MAIILNKEISRSGSKPLKHFHDADPNDGYSLEFTGMFKYHLHEFHGWQYDLLDTRNFEDLLVMHSKTHKRHKTLHSTSHIRLARIDPRHIHLLTKIKDA